MTVRELKDSLGTLADDTVLLTSGHDHSYRMVYASVQRVELTQDGKYFEYFDDLNMGGNSFSVLALILD